MQTQAFASILKIRCCNIFGLFRENKYLIVKSVQIRSLFWFVFSHIQIETKDLRNKSPYSFRIGEITDQKKLRIRTLFLQCEKRKKDCQISVKELFLWKYAYVTGLKISLKKWSNIQHISRNFLKLSKNCLNKTFE